MSTSLYTKYRPATLDSVYGNEGVVDSIRGLLANLDSAPHSYLLTGPTGCGKTTVGRIISNLLGCVGADYIEIDSADFRGIDTVREVRKQAFYKPLEGRCRVWLVDECHKLTGDAQNALLKILEDPPKHVYFILATTDPQKLIPTIKGRCVTYQMSQLNDTQMYRLLRKIVKKEGEELEKEVYDQIIQDSLGHPRNAINVLEQVLKSPSETRVELAKRSAEEQSQVIELCRALIGGKRWKEISLILTGLKDQDPESIRRAVLGYCQTVLLSKDDMKAGLIMEYMIEPFYNTGFPGLVFACYSIIKS